MKIIALVGFASSGKNTVGQYLVDNHNYTSVAFADPVKDCLSVIFGWERDLLEGITQQSRKWREEIDPWWAAKLEIPHFTPRFAMTNFGTDVMRKTFHDQVWILNMEKRLQDISGKVVLSDGRFPNELRMVRETGGRIFRIKRGTDPVWMDTAQAANAGNQLAERRLRDVFKVHQSEWAWIGEDPDGVISNDSGMENLYREIERQLNEL